MITAGESPSLPQHSLTLTETSKSKPLRIARKFDAVICLQRCCAGRRIRCEAVPEQLDRLEARVAQSDAQSALMQRVPSRAKCLRPLCNIVDAVGEYYPHFMHEAKVEAFVDIFAVETHQDISTERTCQWEEHSHCQKSSREEIREIIEEFVGVFLPEDALTEFLTFRAGTSDLDLGWKPVKAVE
jgi:hypothetical protein